MTDSTTVTNKCSRFCHAKWRVNNSTMSTNNGLTVNRRVNETATNSG